MVLAPSRYEAGNWGVLYIGRSSLMFKKFFGSIAAVLALMAVMAPSLPAVAAEKHRVAIHVDDKDPARMNMALNNAANVTKYYQKKGEEVEIEIVAYGPGLHMLRADTSPVKKRLASYGGSFPNVSFKACGNTMNGMAKKEGKKPELLDIAEQVPSGVVRLIELQEKGWSYVRP